MRLNGNKQQVNVSLEIRANEFVLTADNSHKVITLQYKDSDTLAKLREQIEQLVYTLGYEKKQIKNVKVKDFKFK